MTLSNHNLQKQDPGQLVEHHSPSRYATLKHFLDVSLNPDADAEDIAAAVELDPVILAPFLRLHGNNIASIERWFDGIDLALFPAFALSMAGNFLRHEPEYDETTAPETDYWYRSLLHSLIAEQIIVQIDESLADRARLAGLLANLTHMLPCGTHSPQTPEVLKSNANTELHIKAQNAADLLRSWGCTPSFCDAIRYQHAPLENLTDTSVLIRVTALAAQLVEYVDDPDSLPDEIIEISSELGCDSNYLAESIQSAMGKLDRILPIEANVSLARDQLKQTVHDAAVTAIFRKVMSGADPSAADRLTRQSGKFLFSFNKVIRIQLNAPFLEAPATEEETILIPVDSGESIVAACYRDGQLRTVLPENASCVQDNQLLDRIENEVLLCIPLEGEDGILACGMDRNAVEWSEQHPRLLAWYADEIITLSNRQNDRENLTSRPYVENHIRERIDKLIHEVNNPFSIIQNYLHTLSVKLGEDSPLQKEVETISREITRSSGILLSFSETGSQQESPLAETDINEIVEELAGVFKSSNKHIRFNVDLDDSIPAVTTRPDDLKQVLVNLIKNAVECFEEYRQYGNKSKITISTAGSVNVNGKRYVEIVINDNGPGMPQEIREQLFQPNITTKGPEHSGLGLSIVRDLVESLEALISCKSTDKDESAGGTTFSVFIPQNVHDESRETVNV